MTTCGLPRGHGCGTCDTCRNPDGTYASGPADRFVFWVLFWTCVTAAASIVALLATLLTGVQFLPVMAIGVAIPAVLLFLLAMAQ